MFGIILPLQLAKLSAECMMDRQLITVAVQQVQL
jgi:hypothetical protein